MMAEPDKGKRNQINDYEGLETLFRVHLLKCYYKSDVVMIFAHYLLTEVLHYKFVQIDVETEPDGSKKEIYNPNTSCLSELWKSNNHSYKLIYKNETKIRVLIAQKQNRELVLHFKQEDEVSRKKCRKENIGCDKSSSPIILKNYIPDGFLKSNDLSLIDNLEQLNSVLQKFFSNDYQDKIKCKRALEEQALGHNFTTKKVRKDPTILNDSDSEESPLTNTRTFEDTDEEPGKLYLQDKNKHKPDSELNRVKPLWINDPNYYMQEDIIGDPNASYIN